MLSFISVTKGRHELVPKDIKEEAEKYAKVSPSAINSQFFCSFCSFLVVVVFSPPQDSLEEDDDSDEDNM